MSIILENTIPKILPASADDSYDFLRIEGLKHIEQLCSKVWTDYNVHDPGITIMEILCYAITDLSYRIDLPIEDLLAEEQDNFNAMHKKFHSAISILPNCPYSINDYRKLFIDIDGIKNAWLKVSKHPVFVHCKAPSPFDADHNGKLGYKDFQVLASEKTSFNLQGLYKILIELDETNNDEVKAIQDVVDLYHSNRNLCEDLVDVKVVDVQEVRVCAEVELLPEADAETVDASIRFVLQEYLTPSVAFNSLSEMQTKGYTTDQIFEGPVLDHGFIEDKVLESAELRTEVRLSDIIKVIMGVEGVHVIKEINIGFCNEDGPLPDQQVWVLCIKEDHQPRLCTKSVFNYYKDVLPIQLNQTESSDKLKALIQERLNTIKAKVSEDLQMPLGQFRALSDYDTIQNEFPDTYGINQNGLPAHVSQMRRAQAKQLQAYLLFFDQVLAQYFAHLSKVKLLLTADDSIRKTYFNQVVSGIKNGDDLYKTPGSKLSDIESLTAQYDGYPARKNILLDHLISRFAERFFNYAFLMRELYGKNIEDAIIRNKVVFLNEYPELSSKRNCAYDLCHKDKGIWDTLNVSGLQYRVARLSGIRDYSRRDLSKEPYDIIETIKVSGNEYTWQIKDQSNAIILENAQVYLSESEARENMWLAAVLAWTEIHYTIEQVATKFEIKIVDNSQMIVAQRPKKFNSKALAEAAIQDMIAFMYNHMTDEGMYVIEHILLRPDVHDLNAQADLFMPVCLEPDCKGCDPIDPYSFRVSIILPGWTQRLSNTDFRNFLDRLIRLETPAHILPRICWIGKEQMEDFEKVYQEWLTFRFNNPKTQAPDILLKKFIQELTKIHTIYPEGVLHDCDDKPGEEEENPIILGRTNLGNLKN